MAYRIAWIFTAALAVFAVLVTALRVALPYVGDYAEEITARLSAAVGVEMRVASARVVLKGIEPIVELSGIEVKHSPDEKLRAERLLVRFDLPASLLARRMKISALHIFDTDFTIVTDADGNTRLSGLLPLNLALPDGWNGAPGIASPGFDLHLGGANVIWRNKAQAAEYAFKDVSAMFAQRDGRLRAAVKASLPQALGEFVHFAAELDDDVLSGGAMERLTGRVYLRADQAAIAQWTRLAGNTTGDRAEGTLTAELWSEWREGGLQRLDGTVDCAACAFTANGREAAPTSAPTSVQGRLSWEMQTDGWRFGVLDFGWLSSALEAPVSNADAAFAYRPDNSRLVLRAPALKASLLRAIAAEGKSAKRGIVENPTMHGAAVHADVSHPDFRPPQFAGTARDWQQWFGQRARFAAEYAAAYAGQLLSPPSVDVALTVESLPLSSMPALLPREKLRPGLRGWLDRAFVSGTLKSARVEFKGAPSAFPFKRGGHFRAGGEISGAAVNYRRNRRLLHDVEARVALDGRRLSIAASNVRYYDLRSRSVQVIIEDVAAPYVEVEASGEGPFESVFSYLKDAGLLNPNSVVTRALEPDGGARLSVSVKAPLSKTVQRPVTVEGALTFNGTSLRVAPLDLEFSDIAGVLHFDRRGGRSQSLVAKLNGAPVTGRATPAQGATLLTLKGRLPAGQIAASVPLLRDEVHGSTQWRADLLIPRLQVKADYELKMALSSSLEGVAVTLPAPLDKVASDRRDFLAGITLGKRSRYDVSYGDASILITADGRGGGVHALRIDAPWAAGQVLLPVGDGVVRADMSRLLLPEPATETGTDLNPQTLPALDFRIGSFRRGDLQLSQVHFTAAPRDGGMEINRLDFEVGDVAATLNGRWLLDRGVHRSRFYLDANGRDYGRVLQLLGASSSLRGGDGSVVGGIAWDDWPGGFAVEKIEGNVRLGLKDGIIEQADPGIGRLLGLFSVGHVVRRLSLDFRDVIEKGLAFDEMEGAFNFRKGVMHTDNFTIVGPALAMAISGDNHIAERRYDQQIDVVPNLSSGLPIAGALLGGPIAGVAVYLIDKLTRLGAKVDQAVTLRYHLHGSWDDPQIDFKGAPEVKKESGKIRRLFEKLLP